jgi:hypothetical protein
MRLMLSQRSFGKCLHENPRLFQVRFVDAVVAICAGERPFVGPSYGFIWQTGRTVLGQLVRGRRKGARRIRLIQCCGLGLFASPIRNAYSSSIEDDHHAPRGLPLFPLWRQSGEKFREDARQNLGDLFTVMGIVASKRLGDICSTQNADRHTKYHGLLNESLIDGSFCCCLACFRPTWAHCNDCRRMAPLKHGPDALSGGLQC